MRSSRTSGRPGCGSRHPTPSPAAGSVLASPYLAGIGAHATVAAAARRDSRLLAAGRRDVGGGFPAAAAAAAAAAADRHARPDALHGILGRSTRASAGGAMLGPATPSPHGSLSDVPTPT